MPKLQPRVQQLSVAGSIPALPEPEPAWGRGRGGRPWRRKRDRILERDKYLCQCEQCRRIGLLTPATEVDHIIPTSQGGTDDDDNLRAINVECHKLKTARESVAGMRR